MGVGKSNEFHFSEVFINVSWKRLCKIHETQSAPGHNFIYIGKNDRQFCLIFRLVACGRTFARAKQQQLTQALSKMYNWNNKQKCVRMECKYQVSSLRTKISWISRPIHETKTNNSQCGLTGARPYWLLLLVLFILYLNQPIYNLFPLCLQTTFYH